MRRKRESLAERWLGRRSTNFLFDFIKHRNRPIGDMAARKMMRKAAAQGTVRQCNQGE
jgi:hypothetical protein